MHYFGFKFKMNKSEIRQALLKIRHNLSSDQKKLFSQKICQRIQACNFYKNAQKIGLYLSKPDEVDLSYLIDFSTQKQFYIPQLQKDFSLTFHVYQASTQLQQNSWGILEPIKDDSSSIDLDELDLILIPMLGFDAAGHRLGMGKGCYDRTIPIHFTGKKLGVAFECQRYSELPFEAHDIFLDLIVTENQIIKF